jgi:hypothetical protein
MIWVNVMALLNQYDLHAPGFPQAVWLQIKYMNRSTPPKDLEIVRSLYITKFRH